ncbi:MFS transporter [Actinoplanes sp. TBRC 11911]|uniref:MFS transporter n=1 Tax=Actinoplanes sp. TBRC 11911 TaxID=2729386 RepID=UPI002897DD15|nr:MFS transporter [Actinoplanes sp. TBRC 11911]
MTQTEIKSAGLELRWNARLRGILAVLCVVLFLDGLDISMVGVALPSIGTALHMSTTSLQWIVNGYVLGYGGLLLLGGRTADLLGRRKVFLVALGVFTVASLLGGLVDDGGLLIATRFVKGLAAAFTAPAALSILTTTFPEGRARNRALSIFSVFGASGYSSGLIIGGLLTSLGWRWNFLVPVPIALTALIAGSLLIAKDGRAHHGGHDLGGAVTLVAGTLLAVYAVVAAPDRGWLDPLTVSLFVIAAALLAGFAAVESGVRQPLVRLGILRSGTLVRANLSLVAMLGSYFSFQFMMTLYLQDDLRWTPLRVAFALLPVGLIVALSAPLTGRLITAFGTTPMIVLALASYTAGYVWVLTGGDRPAYASHLLPSMILLGFGFGFGYSAVIAQATEGIASHEQGLASGLVQSSGQVGAALVLAVVTGLIATAGSTFTQFHPGVNLVAGVAAAGLLLNVPALFRRRPARRH